jgi:hypothetical protein
LERSERKVDDEEGMVGPGIMVSLDMVAVRPRWVVEVMREARADWSSCEAAVVVRWGGCC